MRRRIKWWLPLGLVLAALLALLLLYRDDVTALARALRYSTEELNGQTSQREAQTDEALAKLPALQMTPLTEEERELLRQGKMSEAAALEILLGGATEPPTLSDAPTAEVPPAAETPTSVEAPAAAIAPGNEPPNTAAPATAPVQTAAPQTAAPSPVPAAAETPVPEQATDEDAGMLRLRSLVAEIYVMRDVYVAKLDGIRDAALETYRSLPEDKRTKAAKAKLASQCLADAKALEAECDQKMETILDEMTELLSGMDWEQTLVSDIRYAYAEEKAQKKAAYLDAYL